MSVKTNTRSMNWLILLSHSAAVFPKLAQISICFAFHQPHVYFKFIGSHPVQKRGKTQCKFVQYSTEYDQHPDQNLKWVTRDFSPESTLSKKPQKSSAQKKKNGVEGVLFIWWRTFGKKICIPLNPSLKDTHTFARQRTRVP